MQDHQHTISEVHNLADTLNSKAHKEHEHADYAPKNHQHDSYAPANHKHNGYAAEQHTHPELEVAIALAGASQCSLVIQVDSSMNIDGFDEDKAQQVICTTTDKAVRIYDYFKSAKPIRYNTQNIVLAPGKTFAATICRGKDVSYVLFNGIIV